MNYISFLKKYYLVTIFNTLLVSAALAQTTDSWTELYSRAADEYNVTFSAEIQTEVKSLEQIAKFSEIQKENLVEYSVKPTLKYMFGPLTHRSLGGEQKGSDVTVAWAKAYIKNGFVVLPYTYKGQWLVNTRAEHLIDFSLPIPLHYRLLRTANWKACTDSQHQDLESYWYYWDPERSGCDQTENVHYQIVNPEFSKKTTQTSKSYPEYGKMTEDGVLSLTFAFGYVEDTNNPNPFTDSDYGMGQFRSFIAMLKRQLVGFKVKESPVLQSEYLGSVYDSKKIGLLLEFEKENVLVKIKVVASGDIDQMELFTKSFAHDHDDYFSWFGHSRVGNGFDASLVSRLLRNNPRFYTITSNYQLVYWAGCNSYSYYTKPFFDLKTDLNDKVGTKSLDIISNGLPSYFSLNADNALILAEALINFDQPTTYQQIVNKLEIQSNQMGIYVLVNVLGDEDNP